MHVPFDTPPCDHRDRKAGRLAETMPGVGTDREDLPFGSRFHGDHAEQPADRRFRLGLFPLGGFNSIQDGAWSLASASPRMSRSTPAAFNRGATEGLRRTGSSLKPASRGHLFLR